MHHSINVFQRYWVPLWGMYLVLPISEVVTDRLIQQAIAQVFIPLFDPIFSEHSYGFCSNKRGHDAVRKARGYIQEGYCWVVDTMFLKSQSSLHKFGR